MYPNKEHLNVKEVIDVLKYFEEKKLLELNEEIDESMWSNQYNNELQEISIDEICVTILTFLPNNFKDISLYDSDINDISFSSDVNFKLNTNVVDELKEESQIPAVVDTNQNDSNIHVFNDTNKLINENRESNDDSNTNNVSNNPDNVENMNNNSVVSSSKSNISNDAMAIPSITVNLESKDNCESLPDDAEKDISLLGTSNSDNMEIIRLDKQSASALLSFSHLLDMDSQSVMSLFDKKDINIDEKDDNHTDYTDNTEKVILI